MFFTVSETHEACATRRNDHATCELHTLIGLGLLSELDGVDRIFSRSGNLRKKVSYQHT